MAAPAKRTVRRLAVMALALSVLGPALATPAQSSKAVVLAPTDLRPESPTSALPEPLTGIETSEVGVLKLWFERRRLLQQGDHEGAQQAVVGILDLMEQGGIRGMENLAGALAHEGQEQLRAGDPVAAIATFELALRFDPDLPASQYGLANARRLSGGGFLKFLRDIGSGVRVSMGNFWWTYMKLGNFFLILLLATTAACIVFVLLMAMRYQSAWRHGMFEFLAARGVPRNLARFLAAGFVVLPLLVWIGGPWILIYWLVGTFRYMGGREKGIALGVLAFCILATPAFALALSIYQMSANDTFRATVSAAKGGYEPGKVKYIQRILEIRPDDPTVRFLLASQLKEGGYFMESFENYKKVLDIEPVNYRAFNNMGNIYFATQQHGQSIHYYRRAIEVRPDYALAHLNTYLAQKELFHFTEAEQSLERARALDPEAVASFLERSEGAGTAVPVDAKISTSEVWVALARESSATPLHHPGETGWQNPLSMAAGAALLVLAVLAFLLRRDPSKTCGRCGVAYCLRCAEDLGPVELCTPCSLLIARPRGAEPKARQRKQRQVQHHQWVVRAGRRVVGLFLPGTGHFLSGRTLRGLALLLIWLFLVLQLALGDRLLNFPGSPAVSGAGPGTWAVFLGLAAVWLRGNLVRFPAFR